MSACARTRAALEAGLPGAALEPTAADHLSGCGECRAYAAFVGRARLAVRSTLERTPGPARLRERERLLQSALRATVAPAAPVRRRGSWIVATALAAVAAVVLVGPRLRSRDVSDAVLDGAVTGVDRDAKGSLPSRGVLGASDGARLRLAQADVKVTRAAQLRWDGAAATVELRHGALDVGVPAARSLRVATDRFVVEVIGARFRIDETGVQVVDGSARVLDRNGAVLADRIAAGASWSFPDAPPVTLPPPSPAAPAAAPPVASNAHKPMARPNRAATTSVDVAFELSQVRAALSHGRADDARGTLDRLLGRDLGRADRAEAETLAADCALVGGDELRAAALYRRVVERYADLPAGEVALFAAARLEQRRGDRATATRLLEQYLGRYPGGMFASEARRRLGDLR